MLEVSSRVKREISDYTKGKDSEPPAPKNERRYMEKKFIETWEETVLLVSSPDKFICNCDICLKQRRTQAKATWEARDAEIDGLVKACLGAVVVAIQEGRKEVVEWVESHKYEKFILEDFYIKYPFTFEQWQEFKKSQRG